MRHVGILALAIGIALCLCFSVSAELAAYDVDGIGGNKSDTPTGPHPQPPSLTNDEDLPLFNLEGEFYPGELLVIRISGDGNADFNIDLEGEHRFFDDGHAGRVLLLPVPLHTLAGSYSYSLSVGQREGKGELVIAEKIFPVQHLVMPEEIAEETIRSQQAALEFEQATSPLYAITDEPPHWMGAFIHPIEDTEVSTPFGAIRYTVGEEGATRHAAIDFSAPLGTDVAAANSGRVLLADYLQISGYTVVLEHGCGLKSWYFHLDSLAVKTGDLVDKGAKLGEVGTTGYSTGPHLHFAVSVGEAFVNPQPLLEGLVLG